MVPTSLRPLSVGEILDVSFTLYRRHFATLGTIAVLCSGLPVLLGLYIEASGGILYNLPLTLLHYVTFTMLSSIATAATVFVVSESYLGRPLAARDALRRATPSPSPGSSSARCCSPSSWASDFCSCSSPASCSSAGCCWRSLPRAGAGHLADRRPVALLVAHTRLTLAHVRPARHHGAVALRAAGRSRSRRARLRSPGAPSARRRAR